MSNFLAAVTNTLNKAWRVVTATIYSVKDVRSVPEAGPYGIDSNPVAGMMGVYLKTGNDGQSVIVGYTNNLQKPLPCQPIAGQGETRIFSTDGSGNLITYLWLHNAAGPGQIEIGGTADNGVGYNQLNTLLSNQATAINAQLALIAAGIAAGGGSYTPTDLPTDFTAIKKDEIKTL